MQNFPIIFLIFIFCLSIFLIIRGHQIGGIHNSKIDEAWKEISICKKCGASNYQIYSRTLDYYEGGNEYKYKVNPKYLSEVNSDDLHEPSSHIFSHFIKIKCVRCGNLMLDECFEFGDSNHSEEQDNNSRQFSLIDNSDGREIVKQGIRKQLFSSDNGGCQKSLSLLIGYGLLVLILIIIIWQFL